MINRVILLGHVEGDPQINDLPNGGRAANLILVTQERWKDGRTGEDRSRLATHKVSIFSDKYIGIVEQLTCHGTLLYVEGVLEERSWTDKQGSAYSSVDVVVRPAKGYITVMGNLEPPTTH